MSNKLPTPEQAPLDEARLRRIADHAKSLLGEPEITGISYARVHSPDGNPVDISLNKPSNPGRHALRITERTGIEGRHVEHSLHPVTPENSKEQKVVRRGFQIEEDRTGFTEKDIHEIARKIGYKENADG